MQEEEALTDDVALVTKTVFKLQGVISRWNSELEDVGMRINERKTKVMMVSRQKKK